MGTPISGVSDNPDILLNAVWNNNTVKQNFISHRFRCQFFLCRLFAEEFSAFGMDPTASNDNAMNRILTTNQSWWDAQRECSHLGGNMYVPPSQSIPEDIIRQLHVNVPYWVGAITYPNWIWTSMSIYSEREKFPQSWKYLLHWMFYDTKTCFVF